MKFWCSCAFISTAGNDPHRGCYLIDLSSAKCSDDGEFELILPHSCLDFSKQDEFMRRLAGSGGAVNGYRKES